MMSFLPFGFTLKVLISFVKTYLAPIICLTGFLGSSAGKESPWNAGDPGWILGLGSFPGEGIVYLPQYSWASLVTKESTCNAGDLGLIPGLGRSPGGGHGNPFPYSCLENPHGQRNLAAVVHCVPKSWT